jgi:cytochrome P450
MSVHETATEAPAARPAATQPAATTEPATVTQPAAATEPATAQPAATQPAATQPPATTEPATATQPAAATEPATAQPGLVQANGAPHGYAPHGYAPEIVFDAFDPAHWPNPYLRYAVARAARPLFPTPLGVYLVTRYQDCAAVLQDDTWSHAHEAQLFHPGVDTTDLPASFLWMDPPDHTRLRGLVSKAFTPRTVAALRPRIERLVRELFDAIVEAGETGDAGEADVITALAYPLPLTVIAELIGAPAADHPDLQRWSRALARGFDPDPLLTPEEREGRSQAAREFVAYFRELVAWRRAEPADDLISELAAVEERGDVLTEDEILATCVTLLVAGHETSVNLVANGLLALIRHPDQYALLRSAPELVAPAVEEMLRYDSPVHLTTRLAHRRTELAGRTFEAGDGVVLLFGSANRDPAAFPDPERFDITRYAGQPPARRHLTFSLGIHYCLGAPLARLEMELVLRELLRRGLTMTLLTDRLAYRRNLVLRGLASLPVRFEEPGVPAQRRLAGRGSGERAGLDPS